ncbi:hypothetical protein EJV47_11015 [Hymenobacter gummosus]|uniref:Uncharacterized protein n=1 Tax=Hymenobacter gummosus TaxID=1776032 RepID=A0A3S0K5X8_9BACT|nr:hypothetical protein [Hymenobacter gummosus]RTQ50158.1 hypothetical protein EJV47_11015 [Hymenobacter gummosus]
MKVPTHFRRVTRNKIIPVKTPKAASAFRLLNPRQLPVTVLEPENFFGAEAGCDFVFQAPDAPAEIYVELKGSDFPKALDQLANTIRVLQSPLQPKHCFVVIRRSPTMDLKTQKQLLNFGKKHRCTMHPPKTQHHEYTL